MKNIITLGEDLEMMKSQMDLLTRFMINQNLISDEMIRRSVEKNVKKTLPSKFSVWFSILFSSVLFPGIIMWETLSKDVYSIPFGIFTVLMSWCVMYLGLGYRKMKIHETLQDGSLLEVSDTITRLRKFNNRNKLVTIFFLITWICWFLVENHTILLSDINQLIMSVIIVGIVTISVISRYVNVERSLQNSLDYIKEMKS